MPLTEVIVFSNTHIYSYRMQGYKGFQDCMNYLNTCWVDLIKNYTVIYVRHTVNGINFAEDYLTAKGYLK